MTFKDYPIEIREKMIDNCLKENYNKRKDAIEALYFLKTAGFNWSKSPEGHEFWHNVIVRCNYELFYNKYPERIQKNRKIKLFK